MLSDAIVERNASVEGAGLAASLIGVNAHVRGSLRQINVGDHSDVDLAGGTGGVPSGLGQT
jgi:hypothetical protein